MNDLLSLAITATLILYAVAVGFALARLFGGPSAQDRPSPRLRVIETLPIAGLLAASMTLVLQAEAGLAYTRAAADSLHAPHLYIDAVMGARPVTRNAGAAP